LFPNCIIGACPLLVKPSSKEIQFPMTKVGESSKAELVLTNGSPILPLTYLIDSMAHYYCIPNTGKIMAGENATVEIVFKPNQFGIHERNLKCVIKSDRESRKGSENSIEGSEMLIKLSGSTINVESDRRAKATSNTNLAYEPMKIAPLKRLSAAGLGSELIAGRLQSHSKIENQDWDDKVKNREIYVDYIRESRDKKVQHAHKLHFNNDGVRVDSMKTSIHHTYTSIDPGTGLQEPSIAKDIFAFEKKDLMDTTEHDLHSHADKRNLEALINTMFSKTVQKLRPGSFPSPKKLIQTSITATELTFIKVSLSSIDLGDITVHSINQIPINFLNAIPNGGKPIQITIVSDDKEGILKSEYFSVTPSIITIPKNQVVGFGVSFQSHEPGIFEQNIAYMINSR
jgi:hypothetical protein